MFSSMVFGTGLWWIFPLLMIGMMVLCFFLMRGQRGSMICRPCLRNPHGEGEDTPDIVNKRHGRGEVVKKEYEEKK